MTWKKLLIGNIVGVARESMSEQSLWNCFLKVNSSKICFLLHKSTAVLIEMVVFWQLFSKESCTLCPICFHSGQKNINLNPLVIWQSTFFNLSHVPRTDPIDWISQEAGLENEVENKVWLSFLYSPHYVAWICWTFKKITFWNTFLFELGVWVLC